MIVTDKISYNTAAKEIIREVSLEIKPVMTALVGPNGSGKTTLIRLLSRYLNPTSGSLYLNEKPLSTFSTLELSRQIAVMCQEEWLSHAMSVVDYVLLGRIPYHDQLFFDNVADIDLALQALDYVGAKSWASRDIHTLSGGEKQRVALARSLVQEPKFLLLDEPTSHMDWAWQKNSLELVRHLNRHKQIGVLGVVHDPNLVSFYFDRIIFIKEGMIVKSGLVKDVLNAEILAEVFGVNFEVYKNSSGHCVYVPHEVEK